MLTGVGEEGESQQDAEDALIASSALGDLREADSQCGRPSGSGRVCVGLAVALPTKGAANAAGEFGWFKFENTPELNRM